VLIGFTLLGGLQWLSLQIFQLTGPGMGYQLALLAAFAVISGLIDLPFDYYRSSAGAALRLQQDEQRPVLCRHGQGRAAGRGHRPAAGVGGADADGQAGDLWWLYTWLVWSGFQLLMMVLYPTVIAPLFNKFTPLEDESLKARIEG
jgi:STE24 endopeptidase